MPVPENFLYAETHEWLLLDGDIATVGITDHAQAELTDIVFVELPKVGVEVTAKQPAAVVESVKAASDIYAPVGGVIIAVNESLSADPGLLNRDPHAEGWLWKMKINDVADVSTLKSPADYATQIGA